METTITELTLEAAALTEEMKKVQFTLNGIQFNPYQHFVQIRAKDGSMKDYLPVAWRQAWFRAARPKGKIRTEIIEHDKELGFIIVKAFIDDKEGGESEAFGSCTRAAFKDYIEKAETKAKGRALADLGYGTQFAEELDEDDALADSPLDRRNNKPSAAPAANNPRPATNQTRQQPPASANPPAASNQRPAAAPTAKEALLQQIDALKPTSQKTGRVMTRSEVLAYVFAAKIQAKEITVEQLVKAKAFTAEQQLLLQAFIDLVTTQREAAA